MNEIDDSRKPIEPIDSFEQNQVNASHDKEQLVAPIPSIPPLTPITTPITPSPIALSDRNNELHNGFGTHAPHVQRDITSQPFNDHYHSNINLLNYQLQLSKFTNMYGVTHPITLNSFSSKVDFPSLDLFNQFKYQSIRSSLNHAHQITSPNGYSEEKFTIATPNLKNKSIPAKKRFEHRTCDFYKINK